MYDNINEFKYNLTKLLENNDYHILGYIRDTFKNTDLSMDNLYFIHNKEIYQLNTCVDLFFFEKIDLNTFFKEVDAIYRKKELYLYNDKNEIVNKQNALINCMTKYSLDNYDIQNNIVYTDDFLLYKNNNTFHLILSENYEFIDNERYFIEETMKRTSDLLDIHISDYERLSAIGYNTNQINQIIKSFDECSIESIVSITTPVELMREYNHILKTTPVSLRQRMRNCILFHGIHSVRFINTDNSLDFVEENIKNLEKTIDIFI